MILGLNIKAHEQILIVAPHPDDETIGCGGVLSIYGSQCDVLLLTDGRRGIPEGSKLTQDEMAAIRKEEFIAVMEYFKVRNYKMLGIPDGELADYRKALEDTYIKGYDRIFVPNRNERHPDHKAAYEILKDMSRKQKSEQKLIEYEVWSPIISANRFLDISSVMDKKSTGLLKYCSQIASIDYDSFIKGLNMYRGAPHHVKYCEAFYERNEEKKRIKQAVLNRLPKGLFKRRT